MNPSLIEMFEKELKNKITLKMIPNQSEEQVLVKYFKYFDLENSGYSNLRDFMRAIEKIGIVLGKTQDIEQVFQYYDILHTGRIEYKQFAKNMFSTKVDIKTSPHLKTISNPPVNISQQTNEPYFQKLHNLLMQNGGAKALISLYKEFKNLGHYAVNRITIDDFIKIISQCKIRLNISEIQLLFHKYEIYNNGIFFYEGMFNDLKNIYHNERRQAFLESFYSQLKELSGFEIKLENLEQMFIPKNHFLYHEGISEEIIVQDFNYLLDSFHFILKLSKSNLELSKGDFVDFFKYFGFGIEDDQNFCEMISAVFDMSNFGKLNEELTSNFAEQISSKKVLNNQMSNPDISPVMEKFIKNLRQFSRKSFFSLIKHFKYYDNGTKLLNKYDFAKVMKDFRLNLTITDIEKLFELHCTDNRQLLLNYEDFIFMLTESSFTEKRKLLVKNVFDRIKGSTNGTVDLEVLKSLYTGKNYPLGGDENDILAEFYGCIELFHFSFKMKKNLTISYEEFEEFYSLISILIEDDAMFSQIIASEWKRVMPIEKKKEEAMKFEITVHDNQKAERESINNNRPVTPVGKKMALNENQLALVQSNYSRTPRRAQTPIKHDPLTKLKDKLVKRGIRGLMNLQKQFLMTCQDVNSITLADFAKVLQLQRLDINKEDLELIFDKFKTQVKGENANYLNFPGFIRVFKKVLPDSRFKYVEKVFASLDVEKTEMLFLDDIKLKFIASSHPDVVKNIRNEDEILTEFIDCFDMNYNLMTTAENPDCSNLISFMEFANFYEYVSFLYDNDQDFINLVTSTWNLDG